MMKSEGQKIHLHLDPHFVGHLPLGLHTQSGDHSDHIGHLGQGRPDPLVALGSSLPCGSLGHIIHHKQRLDEHMG